MRSRRAPVRAPRPGSMVVVGWILAGASVVSSAAAVAMSAAALRLVLRMDAEPQDVAVQSADYTRVRISAVGEAPRVPRVPPLHAAPVPPENPHAPPTPPVGNPIVRP